MRCKGRLGRPNNYALYIYLNDIERGDDITVYQVLGGSAKNATKYDSVHPWPLLIM